MDSILVIEDDPGMQEVLQEMLELDDYQVFIASDGLEGVEMYRNDPTQIVITDLVMPNKDGITVIQELKTEFPEVRIIAISGGDNMDKFERAVEANANRIVAKPFDHMELLEAVAQLMDPTVPE